MSSDSSLFLSPPPSSSSSSSSNDVTKRPKQYPPVVVPAGHVSLQLLCHESLIGPFIGKSGSSIKYLQRGTSSLIRVEHSLPEPSELRVILIVAPSVPFKSLKLRNCLNDAEVEIEVKVKVSAVQEAALRVFEKVLEVSGEATTPLCRFLVSGNEARRVIGKGGKTVERLRRESGSKIRVLIGNHLPAGVSPPHQIIEIQGDVFAVKRALLGVCGQLQECPQEENSGIKDSRPFECASQSSIQNFHADPPLHQPSLSMALDTTSNNHALVGKQSFEADRFSTLDLHVLKEEVIFKILCSNGRVGGVIGRGGSIVKGLEKESGANINFGLTVNNCDERLITISSKENVESSYSPAQRAVVLVFSRSIEAAVERGLEIGLDKGPAVSARLVVPSNQIGCLLGKGGTIISDMRKATGANIHILKGDQVPKCAEKDDVVVEISGRFVNTQDALYHVTSRLRNNLFGSKAISIPGTGTGNSTLDTSIYGRLRDTTHIGMHQSSGTSQFISVGLQKSETAEANPRGFATVDRGFASSNHGIEHGSEPGPAVVTNTTVEVLVPESSISSVLGENGNNLTRIRQISGAKVIVHETHPGMIHRTVVISGTLDETQAAQSLLHAFILTGSS